MHCAHRSPQKEITNSAKHKGKVTAPGILLGSSWLPFMPSWPPQQAPETREYCQQSHRVSISNSAPGLCRARVPSPPWVRHFWLWEAVCWHTLGDAWNVPIVDRIEETTGVIRDRGREGGKETESESEQARETETQCSRERDRETWQILKSQRETERLGEFFSLHSSRNTNQQACQSAVPQVSALQLPLLS